MRSKSPRALVIGTVLREGLDIESIHALFSGEGYGPPPLTNDEIAGIQSEPHGVAPPHVGGGYPQWLEWQLSRALGADLLEEMVALQERASIDLRVSTLKANRDDILKRLRADGYDAEPTRYSPFGIRIPAGASGLEKTQLFRSGAFELQDEASQIAALLVDARSGMRVLDLAAGGGGKSLAMAATMHNEGEIVATDIDSGRLRQLGTRAERAGVTIIRTPSPPREGRGGVRGASTAAEFPLPLTLSPNEGEGTELFDRVLVDAPCSGTGTWRRQPELRWRLTPDRLESLEKTQSWLLEDGARHTKPGGRLAYATCSLLPSENEEQIEAFIERHPEFTIVPPRAVWPGAIGTDPPPGLSDFFKASPRKTGTDGFFTAILARRA